MLEHDFESDLIFKAAISLEWDHHLVRNPLSLNGCVAYIVDITITITI